MTVMVMRKVIRAVVALAASTGCERQPEPQPIWELEASLRTSSELAPSLRAAPGMSGETIAVVADSSLGGQLLDGAHLVRIDAAGAIVGMRALPELGGVGAVAIGIDVHGRAVGVWGRVDGTHYVYGFDDNLEPRWNMAIGGVLSNACCTLAQGMFSVGPEGEVAFTTTDGTGNGTLHYLGNDGVQRWTVPVTSLDHIVITQSGDVLVYRFGFRVQFAASDGTIPDEIAHPRPRLAARDATAIGLDGAVMLYEADGSVRWSIGDRGVGVCEERRCEPELEHNASILRAGDDVLLTIEEREEVWVDGATGAELGSTLHCKGIGFEAADETGYLTLGRNCDGARVLAKYSLPD